MSNWFEVSCASSCTVLDGFTFMVSFNAHNDLAEESSLHPCER